MATQESSLLQSKELTETEHCQQEGNLLALLLYHKQWEHTSNIGNFAASFFFILLFLVNVVHFALRARNFL